eukprot:PITA_20034
MNQLAGTIPIPQPTLLALQQNPQSNLRPQLLAQPNPNPNNKPVQSIQIIETPELETDLRKCNDLQLRSGHTIASEGYKKVQVENQLPTEQPLQEEDVVIQQTHDQETTSSPSFPERLIIPRPIEHLEFDILGELKNWYIKIPLLQAVQDIPIYAKTIKELCIKKPRRRITNNPTVQVVGTLSDLLSRREALVKYEDPGNPIVTVQINGQTFSNALVDLGATINILTTTTCQKLGITSVEPTSTLLELVDRSIVRPEGKPWLATADAYIGCRQGSITITRGSNINNLALYPPAQPSVTIIKPNKHLVSYLTENIRSPLTIQDALDIKDQTENDIINNFINQVESKSHVQCHMIEATFDNELEEDPLKDTHDQTIPTTSISNSKTMEIQPGKTLNINNNLTPEQEEKLVQLLRKYKEDFACDYPDMKGIDPQLCTHNIYTEKDARPVRQPQWRLNLHLKDIVKVELQKLLDINFIYPISDNEWVSPLVVVLKKNGKWRICVDYRELNKET